MKKLYYRFGDIPEDGYSSIWRIDELIGKEKGVSVYEAYKNIDGTYVPVIPFPVTEKGLNDFIYYMAYYYYNYGSRYLVNGNLLDDRGSDGEPLIENVKNNKEIMSSTTI